MSEKVTIYEVAAAANVSTSTVSRVLNDSPKVAEPTRSRVRAVMHELSYVPNGTARNLATGKAGQEGASLAERETTGGLPADKTDGPLLGFEGDWENEECEIVRRAIRRKGDAGTSWVLVKTRLHDHPAFIALMLGRPHWMAEASTARELAEQIPRA